ncbi:hypothetical protein AG0111_0g9387 [Alternaria gaisen]|uniref:Uncharacterized protein n=1 Tax=Alternaria gaisen TaxID=167740 RepID=A0ACB6FE74_9PLEO|nr:hypothetical protein AG0111_0g9387 [Alternaria gaisen]
MTTASAETVQPAIDLASLALCKSDNPVEPAQSPPTDITDRTGLGTIDGQCKQSESDIPAPPTRPPQFRHEQTLSPAMKPAVQSSTKIGRIEESARQQDAAEVMANIFDLISCAITGDGILREGEQGDAIKAILW